MEHIKSQTLAEIDLNALSDNLAQIKSLLPENGKVLSVVKANAYGHGAIEVSRRLEKTGIDMFGVAYLKEAEELRKSGISKEIIIFGGVTEEEAESAVAYNVTPVIFTKNTALKLNEVGKKRNKRIPVHVEIDTGMGRLGTTAEKAVDFTRFIKTLPNISLEGVMTHFAEAESEDLSYTSTQISEFRKALKKILPDSSGLKPHAANSAALLQHPDALYPISRIGLMLYGYHPFTNREKKLNLKPIMTLKTKVIYIKDVLPGTSISYGRTFTASSNMKIATIACGYADGLNRRLSNRGEVLIHGRRAPIIGRVCMDQTMVDISHIGGVEEEDEVVIIGKQEGETITACDIAEKTDTISYEVLCSIGQRVDRIYR